MDNKNNSGRPGELARVQSSPPGMVDRLLRAYLRVGLRGFIRLWRLSGHDSQGTLRAATSFGTVFELSPFGYIDGIVLREGYYESEVIVAISSSLGSGVLWDIGANFGLHGLTAKYLRPHARVVCFEPSEAMLARLRRNCALNRLEVDILGIALSDRTGYQTLHIGPPGNPGMSTLSPWSAGSYAGECAVATACGDELVSQGTAPAPNVIKLDVEGHELSVLKGLARTLRQDSLHTVIFEDSLGPDTPVKEILRQSGFACELLGRAERSQHGLENFVARRPPS